MAISYNEDYANVAPTKVVPVITTQSPYYDDFDENKNYHRILFRPGYAVQARELTQLQTVMQNQIERFGNHIFKNGSIVLGGQLTLDVEARHINLQPTFIYTDVTTEKFKDEIVTLSTIVNVTNVIITNTAVYQNVVSSHNVKVRAYVAGVKDKEPANNGLGNGLDPQPKGNPKPNDTNPSKVYPGKSANSAAALRRAASANANSGQFIETYETVYDPPTLVIKYLTGEEFVNSTVIQTTSYSVRNTYNVTETVKTPVYANVASNNYTGPASTVSISDGIFFINGYFVKIPSQTIIIDKYSDRPNCRVGIEYSEEIITEEDDSSLLDPAQEASNYQAPGAARLKINFDLALRTLDSTDDTSFIELARIENGIIKKQIKYPIYSVLGDTLARRTYDESGDYTVRSFRVKMEDHPTDDSKLNIAIDPGKAYVKGYEFETIAQEKIEIDKSRDFQSVEARDLTINYGNYLYANTVMGYLLPDINQNVTIYQSYAGAPQLSANVIATARVREVKHTYTTDPADPDKSTYRLSLYDINVVNTAYSLSQANSIASATGTANVSSDSKVAGKTQLRDTNYNLLVYPIGLPYVKAGSLAHQNYVYQKTFQATFGATKELVITLAPNEEFAASGTIAGTSDIAYENFIVFSQSGKRVKLASVTVSTSNPQTATIVSDTYIGNATIITKVYTEESVIPRSKVLVTANTSHFVGGAETSNTAGSGNTYTKVYATSGQSMIFNPSSLPGGVMSLYVPDVIEIAAIYDLANVIPSAGDSLAGCIDVTSKYSFNNGQKDDIYDHATIKLANRNASPVGPLLVCYNYYSHSSSEKGYFSVDSYPNSSGTGYKEIPSYKTSTGEEIALRDAIDFRPTKAIGTSGANYTVNGIRFPYSGTEFSTDYSYYLARRAHLTVTTDTTRPFKVVYGESSLNPTEPKPINNGMILYKLYLEPYTAYSSNVSMFFVENRRYTMRDIGKLEARIENLEYYQSLTLLEKKTSDLKIMDNNGLERTKYGILADNFTTHGYGAVDDPDYLCSVDKLYGGLRPAQNTAIMELFTSSSSNTKTLFDSTTLTFTEEKFIEQNAATKWISVQPYAIAQWIGTIVMNPPDDYWTDTVQAPDVILNFGDNDALVMSNSIISATGTSSKIPTIDSPAPRGRGHDWLRNSRAWQRRRNNIFVTEAFWWTTFFGSRF